MTTLAYNATVTYDHGRLEKHEIKSKPEAPSPRYPRQPFVRENTGGPFHVPGIKVGINMERPGYTQFSHGFCCWRQERLSKAEVLIMQVVSDITDKRNWHIDVDNFSVSQTWKEQAFSNYLNDHAQGGLLWEWCLFELRKKAAEFQASPERIFVLDTASRVCKSDRLFGTELLAKLEEETDDLYVCPWMYSFIYGHSPLRVDGVDITLDNINESVGIGRVPNRPFFEYENCRNGQKMYYSRHAQWTATDVKFTGEGNNVRIVSPINNLHPGKHRSVYSTIEHLISDSLEDWNKILLYKTLGRGVSRVKSQFNECLPCYEGKSHRCSCKIEFRDFTAWSEDKKEHTEPDSWKEDAWNPIAAMDGKYGNSRKLYDQISLSQGFKERGIQVYFEISAIEVGTDGKVTEDSARYLEWNINGNRNEKIVATTFLCLRRENIHPFSGGMSFRSETKRHTWERPGIKPIGDKRTDSSISPLSFFEDAQFLASAASARSEPSSSRLPSTNDPFKLADTSAATSCSSRGRLPTPGDFITPSFQALGTLRVPEGRLITFPNALQHKFEAPLLNDAGRPGWIQFLQIHLVDPHYILASTRHIAPRSLDWWCEAVGFEEVCTRYKVPEELSSYVIDELIGPERTKNGRPMSRSNMYWRGYTMFTTNPMLMLPPPVRHSAALRARTRALAKHARIMQAVNGPKIFGTPTAFQIWLRNMRVKNWPQDCTESRDLVTMLDAELVEHTMPELEETAPGGHQYQQHYHQQALSPQAAGINEDEDATSDAETTDLEASEFVSDSDDTSSDEEEDPQESEAATDGGGPEGEDTEDEVFHDAVYN